MFAVLDVRGFGACVFAGLRVFGVESTVGGEAELEERTKRKMLKNCRIPFLTRIPSARIRKLRATRGATVGPK